jgi:hypothetical protein
MDRRWYKWRRCDVAKAKPNPPDDPEDDDRSDRFVESDPAAFVPVEKNTPSSGEVDQDDGVDTDDEDDDE